MTNPWHLLPVRFRRPVIITTAIIIGLFGLDLLTVIGFSVMHPAVNHKVDAVIILGAKVGTPALKYRTLTGLKYYEEGKTDTLVLSGAKGSNEPSTEAQAMETVIRSRIAESHSKMPHIILETKSTDTFQNLSNSRALIPNASSVVVVSDGYHLARSVALAKHIGFSTVYWDAPKPTYYATVDLVHYYVREAVAMIVYLPTML
jgi:uncharacterized SAM-binding protein YcdF (DUF218 family)